MHAFFLADLLSGFGINLWAFISQLVSFAIVFLILWRWGFPVILRTLAAKAEEVLQVARLQAQETIERATRLADQEAIRIQEEAHARAAQIEQQQIARIQQEAARARAELSRLVVNLSIDAARKVIRKSVNTADNRRLVQEFVNASEIREQ